MLPELLVKPLVAAALAEDLGRRGDITTEATIPAEKHGTVALVAREAGVVAGLQCAVLAWELVAESAPGGQPVAVAVAKPDGAAVRPGETIATISGPVRALLTGERVALNFLGHLSGVATATAQIAQAIAHTKSKVADTRKTLPGLRAVEKDAVLAGGGVNHRFGLDDAVLIKDNHIAAAGSLTTAVLAAKAHVGHLVKIEVEVDSLAQLSELLEVGADAVLLDNMPPETLRAAVELVDGRMLTEASGKITAENAAAIAESGVDLLSAGWITHSAKTLDIGLDWVG